MARLLGKKIATRAPNTAEVLANEEWQEDAVVAIGECMHHYGLSAADVASHPLAKLALVSFPLAMAVWSDYQLHRDAAARAAMAAPPPPVAAATGPAATSFGAERMPPASSLANRA